MTTRYTPESPDNKSIREQLEEMKKLNTSTARYNKLTIWLSVAILLLTFVAIIIDLFK